MTQQIIQKPLPQNQQKIIDLSKQGYTGKFQTCKTSRDNHFNEVNHPSSRAMLIRPEQFKSGLLYELVSFRDVLALEKKGLVTVTYASLDHAESEGTFKLKEVN